MKMLNCEMRLSVVLAALFAAFAANAEVIKVAYCERDPKLDFWANADNEFCIGGPLRPDGVPFV